MSETNPGNNRQITISQNAIGSTIISGDGNQVFIYHHQVDKVETKSSTPDLGDNPYRGLEAFQAKDADVYFGREAQVERLWNRLREFQERAIQTDSPVRLLPILGASGSGKSSLARAGLLPELARHPLPSYRQTYVAEMKPGTSPLEGLARVLARIATSDHTPSTKRDEFEAIFRRSDGQGKHDQLRKIVNDIPCLESAHLVILIDQFEEVYSLCKDANERSIFIDNLIAAASSAEARVSVVITMRLDFVGETQRHPLLNQIIGSDQSAILPVMTPQELHRAIAEPAKQAGHPLDEVIVDRLIEQTERREGALPLLQFALTQIWEGLRQGKSAADTLKAIGGVGGALAGKAQGIYDSLNDKEKDIARRIFVGLVELGEGTQDTRRRATVESLTAAQDNSTLVREVIGRFSVREARLLTLSRVEGEAASVAGKEVAEVTHEALLDHWQQIKEWLDGQRDRIRRQRRINTLAEEWKEHGKMSGYLLHGRQLDDARIFHERYAESLPLSENAAEFVWKSLGQRRFIQVAIASFLILPTLVVNGFLQGKEASRNYAILDSKDTSHKPEAVKELVKGCKSLGLGGMPGRVSVGKSVFGTCRTLQGRNLEKTDLSNADLSNVDLSRANLSRANLSNADLSEANLSNAILSNAILSNADLRSAILSDADLSGANLSKAKFLLTNLDGTNLSNVNLSYADLSSEMFINANLSYADLSYADLRDADLNRANLNRANLSRANLSNADLSNANLSNANLSNANLSGAILLVTNLSNSTRLEQAQLTKSENSPLLCNVKLPAKLKHLADRDCDRLPQVLLERYPSLIYKNLEEAKKYVEAARKR